MKDSLFMSYALGRVFSGTLCSAMGIIFVTWLVNTLGQQGIGIQEIAGTIAGLVVTIMFSTKAVLDWAANRPYQLVVYYTICMIVDITIVFSCQDLPWLILGSSAFTSVGPTIFYEARAVMLNRVMASDKLTLFGNRLNIISIVGVLAGSGLGMIIPVSLDAVGWISLTYLILIVQANLWQIRELQKMPKLKLD